MIEQDFDVGDDNASAVFINGVSEFFLYLIEAVEDSLPFAFRHVQGFVHFVGEESVVLHLPRQRCTPDEVGMEQQGISLRMQRLAAVIDTAHLPWSDKHQRTLLIVILAAPVGDRPVNLFFQEDGIEAEAFTAVAQYFHA